MPQHKSWWWLCAHVCMCGMVRYDALVMIYVSQKNRTCLLPPQAEYRWQCLQHATANTGTMTGTLDLNSVLLGLGEEDKRSGLNKVSVYVSKYVCVCVYACVYALGHGMDFSKQSKWCDDALVLGQAPPEMVHPWKGCKNNPSTTQTSMPGTCHSHQAASTLPWFKQAKKKEGEKKGQPITRKESRLHLCHQQTKRLKERVGWRSGEDIKWISNRWRDDLRRQHCWLYLDDFIAPSEDGKE